MCLLDVVVNGWTLAPVANIYRRNQATRGTLPRVWPVGKKGSTVLG